MPTSTEKVERNDGWYTIDDALSAVGSGPFQHKLLFLTGFIWAADAMEMMLLSFLIPKLKEDWDLEQPEDGLIGFVVFAGNLIGTIFFAVMSDRLGRRKVVLLANIMCAVFGLLTGLAPNIGLLLVLRFGVGFSIGGAAVSYVLFAEYAPKEMRGSLLIIEQGFWSVGALFSVFLAWLTLTYLNWRWYLILSSVPLWLVSAFYKWIPESSRWLVASGQYEKAQEMLERVARENGTSLPPGRLKSAHLTKLLSNSTSPDPIAATSNSPEMINDVADDTTHPKNSKYSKYSKTLDNNSSDSSNSSDAANETNETNDTTNESNDATNDTNETNDPNASKTAQNLQNSSNTSNPSNFSHGADSAPMSTLDEDLDTADALVPQEAAAAPRGKLRDAFVPAYRATSIQLLIAFFLCVFGYYGISFISERFFEASKNTQEEDEYWEMAVTTSSEIPGLVLGALFLDRWGRKNSMILCFGTYSLCSFCLALDAVQGSPGWGIFFMFVGRMCVSLGFLVIYVYYSEYYPTVIRTTALGFASAMGRIAGMVTSFVSEDLPLGTGMILYAVGGVVCTVCIVMLERDTTGMDMATEIDTNAPKKKSVVTSGTKSIKNIKDGVGGININMNGMRKFGMSKERRVGLSEFNNDMDGMNEMDDFAESGGKPNGAYDMRTIDKKDEQMGSNGEEREQSRSVSDPELGATSNQADGL